jgi:predicted ester cyclase
MPAALDVDEARAGCRPLETTAIDMIKVRDGQIVEHWGLFDQIALMVQMGVMPPLA